jgi:Kef-type K+ transport system membrane component KefB
MDLLALALIVGVGALGALLAAPRSLRCPVVVGELAAGVLLGETGIGVVKPDSPLIKGLGELGFATVMLIAGSHVPITDRSIRPALGRGAVIIGLSVVPAVIGGILLASLAGTGHAPLYAVLLSSTSAALVLPLVSESGATGPQVLVLIAQAAMADAACIVALPLVADPHRALGAAAGGLAIAVGSVAVWTLAHVAAGKGWLIRLHHLSVERNLGIELRLSLCLLLILAGVADHLGTSVMLAGFACGLVLNALGEPRRLARQLFGISDAFLAPVFFVRLGATLDLRALGSHPRLVVVGLGLGLTAVIGHAVAGRLLGQPLPFAALAAAQLGVPVAAVTIGQSSGALRPGEGAAIILGALVTIVAAVVSGRLLTNKKVST